MSSSWATLIVIAVVLLYFISIYNSLVGLRNRFKNAFSQIDVQLKRRYELIPNLVETAKKYMQHESDTLEAVIQARNSAASAGKNAAAHPDNATAIKTLIGAETALGASMGSFLALSESYPDLKANTTISELLEELTSTENKVSYARQAFNDAVMRYNTKCEQFPDNIIAGFFRFMPAEMFEITNPQEKEAVKVSFD
ncbi:MAG: LemA family protein [Gammaproteobacteria bacterium]|nr:LemA family protein [Gammaproteobacteria bacterium]